MMNSWLFDLSKFSVGLGVLSALIVATDLIASHKQRMWIMNLVWPLTCLYAGPVGLWAYFRLGRRMSHEAFADGSPTEPPMVTNVALGSTHCGSGCTLGDLLAESLLITVPLTLFGHKIFASWAVDFIAAFAFGIAFQYFTIKPMRGLSVKEGLKAALKG